MNYFKAETAIVNNTSIGNGSKIWHYANVYGCTMGENCTIGAYTEIQNDVHFGNNAPSLVGKSNVTPQELDLFIDSLKK